MLIYINSWTLVQIIRIHSIMLETVINEMLQKYSEKFILTQYVSRLTRHPKDTQIK